MSRDTLTEREADELDSQTVALWIVAMLLVSGAGWLLGTVLIPFFLALILSIALSPLADQIERLGLGRTLASVLCLLAVVLVLAVTVGLVGVQAGEILQQSDTYLDQFGRKMGRLSDAIGGNRLLEAVGEITPGDSEAGGEPTAIYWDTLVRRNARVLGRWVVSGLGGLIGFLGGVVVTLAFLFYMLLTRSAWIGRLKRATFHLGLRPRTRRLERIRNEIATYLRQIAIVSAAYVVVISLALWAIGVPQPLLWGILTGLLEVVPYFGPLIAGALPTIVALGTDGASWQPLAVVALFAALQTVEGYVVAPMLYGQAVDIDPVTVLLGVLFFGFLWGPLGLALAMPMMILLRGLVAMTPDTPALDALVDAGPSREETGSTAPLP
jgi:predicted PurR-regulated permease PerM